MKKTVYLTDGKRALCDFLAKNPDRQFTTEELCLALHGNNQKRSSVYRHLSELCADNILRKFRNEEQNCAVYQYVGTGCDCGSHFHAKCLRCGAIHHLACNDSLTFAKHLQAEHGFSVDCGQSILYGVCQNCRRHAEGT
ncbi:MAG: transcriptional repressor [Ruminococcaceae bacterium]|nr:transcriptional repressor [Oscillospiraceae bacterium]